MTILDALTTSQKLTTYLQQENEVLIERIRLLELAVEREREACAKVVEEYAWGHYLDPYGNDAKAIAALIRGRG
jgi:hypothetical protein